MDADGIKHRRVWHRPRGPDILLLLHHKACHNYCLPPAARPRPAQPRRPFQSTSPFQCSGRSAGTDDSHTSTSTITIRHCLNHTVASLVWMDPPHIVTHREGMGPSALSEDLNCGLDNSEVVDDFWSRCPSIRAWRALQLCGRPLRCGRNHREVERPQPTRLLGDAHLWSAWYARHDLSPHTRAKGAIAPTLPARDGRPTNVIIRAPLCSHLYRRCPRHTHAANARSRRLGPQRHCK